MSSESESQRLWPDIPRDTVPLRLSKSITKLFHRTLTQGDSQCLPEESNQSNPCQIRTVPLEWLLCPAGSTPAPILILQEIVVVSVCLRHLCLSLISRGSIFWCFTYTFRDTTLWRQTHLTQPILYFLLVEPGYVCGHSPSSLNKRRKKSNLIRKSS